MNILETIEEYIAEIIAILSLIAGLISFIIALINKHKLNKIKTEIEDEKDPELTEEQKLAIDEYKINCYKLNLQDKKLNNKRKSDNNG